MYPPPFGFAKNENPISTLDGIQLLNLNRLEVTAVEVRDRGMGAEECMLLFLSSSVITCPHSAVSKSQTSKL